MPSQPAKPAILISRLLPKPAVDLARSRAEIDAYAVDGAMPRAELLARLAGKRGLICVISEVIDQALLDACPDLRVVSNVAVGFNNVDVAACTRRGVVVTNTPDVLTDTTADFAWALLMATARRVVEADRYLREGRFQQWEYMTLLGGDVHGKTLGVVGFGRIGRAVARRAQGFGMRVLYQDAVAADAATERELHATRADLATLLRESDFVTLHTPLIPETRHLINAQSLRTMKKTAFLINAARGPVVDEAALVQALEEGWIAGAGLDVFEEEPKVHPGLIGLPTVVLAPHIASALLRDAAQDGHPRGRELPRRARGQDAAHAGQSRGADAPVAVELLVLDRVSKRFGPDASPAVDGLSLRVAEGEILALLGPSGCGKTTTLRLIAGLETPDAGTITLRGRLVAGPGHAVPPEERGVGIVFQDYAPVPAPDRGRQRGLRPGPGRPP